MTAPAIILVAPQLGENIGTAARAMANLGLTDLRLVGPRDGHPNERAHTRSEERGMPRYCAKSVASSRRFASPTASIATGAFSRAVASNAGPRHSR